MLTSNKTIPFLFLKKLVQLNCYVNYVNDNLVAVIHLNRL